MLPPGSAISSKYKLQALQPLMNLAIHYFPPQHSIVLNLSRNFSEYLIVHINIYSFNQ